MATGQQHAAFGKLICIAASATALATALGGQPQTAAGICVGALGGLLITPDIDHWQRTHEEIRIYRAAGPLAGRLWQAYWSPYAILIPHRHWLSHLPGVGTIIRIAYLCLPLALLLLYLGQPLPALPRFYAAALAAWTVQDTFHLALDNFRLRQGE